MHDPAFVHTVWTKSSPGMGIYFEMPLLSGHQAKELGQNLLTSRNCHSKFLFLWRILTDIPVMLTTNHRAETKSPHTTLPKEGKRHCKSKFTALVIRESLSFWFPKGLVQGEDIPPKYQQPCFLLPSLWDIHMVLSFSGNPAELPLFHSEIPKHPPLIPLLRSNISNSHCVLGKKRKSICY